jgi:hypothetical protein
MSEHAVQVRQVRGTVESEVHLGLIRINFMRNVAYVQLSTIRTLSIALLLFKTRFRRLYLPSSSGKNPTQLRPTDRASPYLRSGWFYLEDGDRIQSPKHYVLKYKRIVFYNKT